MNKANSGINSKIHRNKKAVFSLSLILLLAMTMIIAFAHPGLAQIGVPQPEKTAGYISVAPQLVGVGQKATVNLWLFPLPSTYLYAPFFEGFFGIEVTFVKPDGTKDTFMPVDGTGQYVPGETESTGSLFFFYEPDQAGNWSVSFTMPAQNITDSTGTVQYLGCTSNTAYFTVQTEPVLAGLLNGYPWSPLPNDNVYWSYPINSNNREWNQISGDWLQGQTGYMMAWSSGFWGVTSRSWQPYGSGPNTAHIVWSQPLKSGGIIGGDYGSYSYGLPTAATPPGVVVMGGKAFTNIPNTGQFECIDLETGKVLYTADGSILNGIHLPGDPHAQAGLDPSVLLTSSFGSNYASCLFGASGATWNYYDSFTGTLRRSIANVSAMGYQVLDGTNLAYGATSDKLFAWDLSKVVNNNWPTGITWTRPLPESLLNGSASLVAFPSVFGISKDLSTIVVKTINQFWGYSAKDGTSLWNLTLTYPLAANEDICLYGVDDFVVFDPIEVTFKCYSMITGKELWTSPSYADSPWATTWNLYAAETNDYENLYLILPDGTAVALNLETGKEVWRSTAFPSTEYTNNVVPYVEGMILMGGNIYVYAGYSVAYQINPIPRQSMLLCINATTGDIAWTLNGGIFPVAASKSYIIGDGMNDGNLYCVGKGQTSTTLTASPKVGITGSSILVEGTVMDQSPASLNTPAIADESMSEWMDYLHMQNATLLNNPPNPKGVTVRLAAVDPNGNVIDIGTVTSDSGGMYKKAWTPPAEGEYTIYATFDGSNSYFGSYAETALSIDKAPTETSTAQQAIPDYTMTIMAGVIAIIIAVAIAAVVIIVMVRKK